MQAHHPVWEFVHSAWADSLFRWSSAVERFCQSCGELASRHSVFHQVKLSRRGHMRDQTGLVPCQGLDLGYVIAKRPPLSDFALSPTRIFKINEALAKSLHFEKTGTPCQTGKETGNCHQQAKRQFSCQTLNDFKVETARSFVILRRRQESPLPILSNRLILLELKHLPQTYPHVLNYIPGHQKRVHRLF